MKITTTKTTTTRTTITHKATLTDDSGKQIAVMSGTADSTRPFGSTSFTVLNQSLFEANREAIRAQYEAFQAEIASLDANPVTETETTESDIKEE
ncbi:MAG: hypothetical protein LUH09_09340 [Clostridiales bacterium]|nr:hypothetical protein [Clostridiales bacterium]